MVIIRFPSGVDWFRPNWVYRQFAADMTMEFPQNHDLEKILEWGEAFGALYLDSLPTDTAAAIMEAMTKVADETAQGKILGWKKTRPDDKAGHDMYLSSIAELLSLLRKEQSQRNGQV